MEKIMQSKDCVISVNEARKRVLLTADLANSIQFSTANLALNDD